MECFSFFHINYFVLVVDLFEGTCAVRHVYDVCVCVCVCVCGVWITLTWSMIFALIDALTVDEEAVFMLAY